MNNLIKFVDQWVILPSKFCPVQPWGQTELIVTKLVKDEGPVWPNSFLFQFFMTVFVHVGRLGCRPVRFQLRDTLWGNTEESSSGRRQCHNYLRTEQTKTSTKNAQNRIVQHRGVGLLNQTDWHTDTYGMSGVNTLDSNLGSTMRRCSVSLLQSSVRIFFSLALITWNMQAQRLIY